MRSNLDSIVTAIREGWRTPSLLLLTDFDGTLVEFDEDPNAVFLPGARQRLLASLTETPGMTVGVVSGRRVADVRDRLGLGQRVYSAGLHGLEIEGPAFTFRHPAAAGVRELLQSLAPDLQAAIRSISGAFVENKDLSLAVHVRAVRDADAAHGLAVVS